jgi:hypothetical protein
MAAIDRCLILRTDATTRAQRSECTEKNNMFNNSIERDVKQDVKETCEKEML